MTIAILGMVTVFSVTGCGNNTNEDANRDMQQNIVEEPAIADDNEKKEIINEELVMVLRWNSYVSISCGDYGFFEIVFYDDYSCDYCIGLKEPEMKQGIWSVDEYSILTVKECISSGEYGNDNYFEILPCVTDGTYRLKYMSEVSDGWGEEAIEVTELYPKYDCNYVELDNVLGETASYVYYAGTMPLIGKYFLNDSLTSIEVWGTNPDDVVIIDLDGDGRNELIASVIWGDGVEDGLVYTSTEEGIKQARGSSLLEYEYVEGYAWAVMAEYFSESNTVQIAYIAQGETEYCYVEYELKLEQLAWEIY